VQSLAEKSPWHSICRGQELHSVRNMPVLTWGLKRIWNIKPVSMHCAIRRLETHAARRLDSIRYLCLVTLANVAARDCPFAAGVWGTFPVVRTRRSIGMLGHRKKWREHCGRTESMVVFAIYQPRPWGWPPRDLDRPDSSIFYWTLCMPHSSCAHGSPPKSAGICAFIAQDSVLRRGETPRKPLH
jgi:hypothetical protein